MDNEKRERILKGIAAIPDRSLANYILRGEVSAADIFSRLQEINNDQKAAAVRSFLVADDDKRWNEAVAANTADAFSNYLQVYPTGQHAAEAQQKIGALEVVLWQQVTTTMSADAMNRYLRTNPNGPHAQECRDMLDDLPWLEARKQGTIAALQQYQSANPGKHTDEIAQLINDLNDDTDWRNAQLVGRIYAYEQYLAKHPAGKHVAEAQQAIMSVAGRDMIIDNLQNDINAYSASDLQRKINNYELSWDDLGQVFSPAEVEAIRSMPDLVALPYSDAPETLEPGTTEVYFWGTPSSGKTCALGAILSAADSYGMLTKQKCSGAHYMNCLCKTFDGNDMCNLPKGTDNRVIQEMCLSLRDKKKKQHPLTLIDMAGETFKAMYHLYNDIPGADTLSLNVVDRAQNYLVNETNKKIHFFIVEYGEEDKPIQIGNDYVSMVNILEASMNYLNEKKIVRRSTNGIYLLVSKADNMPCAPEERQQFAEDYVRNSMPSFYNALSDLCSKSGVSDFQILPFSVGRVFAQTLCHFERDNTDCVLNKLIAKSATEKSSFWKFFNS